MTAYAFVILIILGALVYCLTSGKLSELGRLTFAAGLLGAVLHYAGKVAHLMALGLLLSMSACGGDAVDDDAGVVVDAGAVD
jgi:hypothetical protein